MKKRLLAVVVLSLVLMNIPSVVYAGRSDAIEISTAEDLIALSRESDVELYTKGRKYVLTRDIDLSGTDFKNIKLFAGDLDGGSHMIKGFALSGNESDIGFIGTLTAEGCVHDLKVTGSVSENDSNENIGIIAGINYGTIKNCDVEGTVISYKNVGGIVGRNMPSANIINCENAAEVMGTKKTGGIAGFNEGYISGAVNTGEINASTFTAHERLNDPDDESMEFKDIDICHTGGIAGESTGVITGSKNTGRVGEVHMTAMTGGIAGYDRGLIVNCDNSGEVKGRRNIGGITGILEPYAEIRYEEDTLDKAGDEFDRLVSLTGNLNSTVDTADDAVQGDIDAIRAEADDLRSTVSNYKAYYRAKNDGIENELYSRFDAIRADLDAIDIDTKVYISEGTGEDPVDILLEMYDLVVAVRQARSAGVPVDVVSIIGQLADKGDKTFSNIDSLIGAIDEGDKKLSKKAKKAIEKLEDVRDKLSSLDDYCRNTVDDYKADERKTSDDIQARIERLADESDRLSNDLKSSDKEIRSCLDDITGQLKTISNVTNDGIDEARDKLNDLRDDFKDKKIYEDISEECVSENASGMGEIRNSENEGIITGDFNVGGVAGSIDVTTGRDSDFETVSSGDVSMKFRMTKSAVIKECINNSNIVGYKDYIGGIVGNAEYGVVYDCSSMGNIVAEDSRYVGGIAGNSELSIEGSNVFMSVSGNKFAGGIAGYGSSLKGNRSVASVEGSEKTGSIAGQCADDAEVVGNIYVETGSSAIDGGADSSMARQVSYAELVSMDGVPKEFGTVHITFVFADGMTAERRVRYGGSLGEEEIPKIPKKDEEIGYWSESDFKGLTQNKVVYACYVPWVTTIADPEQTVLVSGNFYEGTSLKDEVTPADKKAPEEYEAIEKHSLSIDSVYGVSFNDLTIRLRAGEKTTVMLENGEIAKGHYDGNYYVFTSSSPIFYVIRKKDSMLPAAAAGAVFILIAAAAVLRHRRVNTNEKR
ncbi:MAG: hypothetical protein K6F39_07205 [Lachnospiraceae bacterium]|nr:hypothetical protein [Lachnospiraceae bacterium]